MNEKQEEIIKDENSFVLVSAGAGTGKTTTIVEKIKYLVTKKSINPSEIICISFTNESTNNLKERLNRNNLNKVNCYTFHKLSLLLLKNNKYNIASNDLLEYIIEEYFKSIIFNFPDNIKRVLNYLKVRYSSNFLQKYKKLEDKKVLELKTVINRFISLLKTNNQDSSDILSFIKDENKKYYRDLLVIIYHINNIYNLELKSTNSIDFNDMINKAINTLKDNDIKLNIKYLIIDEYQDTSKSKFELIKILQDKTKCNLFVVGDDFQSIYKFTGCDLDIFFNFTKHFKNARTYKLERTYRNSNELVKLASSFVMKNKRQINKNLYSSKHLKRPISIIYYKNLKKSFIKLIENIYNEAKKPILILGRNNFDINEIINCKDFVLENDRIIYLKNKEIEMRYLTVHSAKGLEGENVILINLLNSKNGFPSKKEDNYILKYVMPNNKEIKNGEERRLFYVALTRTKNKNYIMTQKNRESIFVKEIIKNYRKFIKIKKE